MKIDGLQKQIADSLEQCTQMQQFWLRQQNDLVQKTKVVDDQTSAVDFLKKQLLILSQKKPRTDNTLHLDGLRESMLTIHLGFAAFAERTTKLPPYHNQAVIIIMEVHTSLVFNPLSTIGR